MMPTNKEAPRVHGTAEDVGDTVYDAKVAAAAAAATTNYYNKTNNGKKQGNKAVAKPLRREAAASFCVLLATFISMVAWSCTEVYQAAHEYARNAEVTDLGVRFDGLEMHVDIGLATVRSDSYAMPMQLHQVDVNNMACELILEDTPLGVLNLKPQGGRVALTDIMQLDLLAKISDIQFKSFRIALIDFVQEGKEGASVTLKCDQSKGHIWAFGLFKTSHKISAREVTVDIKARDASMPEDESAAQTDMDEDGNLKIKIRHHHNGDKRLFSLYGHNRNAASNGWLPVLPGFEMSHDGSLRVNIGVGIGMALPESLKSLAVKVPAIHYKLGDRISQPAHQADEYWDLVVPAINVDLVKDVTNGDLTRVSYMTVVPVTLKLACRYNDEGDDPITATSTENGKCHLVQPVWPLANSANKYYLVQPEAIADGDKFFHALLGAHHLLSVHRQDERLFSPWLDELQETLAGNESASNTLGNGRRLSAEFLDLGASSVSTMTSGYYNKDCWVANFDDWFTTSGCMQDYNNWYTLEFDIHNWHGDEVVYMQMNTTEISGEYSRMMLRSASGTSALYDFTAQLYGSTKHGLNIGFEDASLKQTLHLDDPNSTPETWLENITLHFDFNVDDEYMTFDFDPNLSDNFDISELSHELPISISSGIQGFGRTYDDINSLYMKITDLELTLGGDKLLEETSMLVDINNQDSYFVVTYDLNVTMPAFYEAHLDDLTLMDVFNDITYGRYTFEMSSDDMHLVLFTDKQLKLEANNISYEITTPFDPEGDSSTQSGYGGTFDIDLGSDSSMLIELKRDGNADPEFKMSSDLDYGFDWGERIAVSVADLAVEWNGEQQLNETTVTIDLNPAGYYMSVHLKWDGEEKFEMGSTLDGVNEPGHMSMSIIDFMVEVEEEVKVKEGDLTIDMDPYGGSASVQGSVKSVDFNGTDNEYITSEVEITSTMTYTGTENETSVMIEDVAIKIVDGFFNGMLDWETSYDASFDVALIHENTAVDFSRRGGDPIARVGAKMKMDDGAGYTLEMGGVATIDKSDWCGGEQSMALDITMNNSEFGFTQFLEGSGCYIFDVEDLSAMTMAITEAQVKMPFMSDTTLAFATIINLDSTGAMCMDMTMYGGDEAGLRSGYYSESAYMTMTMDGCMQNFGDMAMSMDADGENVMETSALSTVIGSGTADVMGVVMYTMGDMIVHQTGSFGDIMVASMDAGYDAIYSHEWIPSPTMPPVPQPTARPNDASSLEPTPNPTPDTTQTVVTWTTTLSMSGVTAADFGDEEKTSFKESIAAASDDLSAYSITITSITDVSRRRRLSSHIRALLSSGVDIEYETMVILEETSYADTTALFSTVTEETETHVTTGGFETALQSSGSATLAAVDVAEESFVAPTTFEVVVVKTMTPSVSPTPAPPSNKKKAAEEENSTGIVIGIILGVLFVAGGAGAAWYLQQKKGASVAPESILPQIKPKASVPVAAATPVLVETEL